MTKQITKAIIPVAGFGTRFLSATKVHAKEMFPIVDKPIIEFLVDEAVASGITDILFITHPTRSNVIQHFAYDKNLEDFLKNKNKHNLWNKIEHLHKQANFSFAHQEEPLGNGDAISRGRDFVGDEPFAVFYADDVMISKTKPALQQLIDVYNKYGVSVMGLVEVSIEEVNKYGVIKGKELENEIYEIESVVEKPEPHEAPSNLTTIGRMVLQPKIFEYIQKQPAKNGEVYLSEAVGKLASEGEVYGKKLEGTWHDCGSAFGFWRANLEIGLEHPEIKERAKDFFKKFNEKN